MGPERQVGASQEGLGALGKCGEERATQECWAQVWHSSQVRTMRWTEEEQQPGCYDVLGCDVGLAGEGGPSSTAHLATLLPLTSAC